MKKLMNKLRSRVGETLVETMAAILVFTLSSVLLLSMIASAVKINTAAKKEDQAISSELLVAEAQTATPASQSISITVNEQKREDINVNVYAKGVGTLYSFDHRG